MSHTEGKFKCVHVYTNTQTHHIRSYQAGYIKYSKASCLYGLFPKYCLSFIRIFFPWLVTWRWCLDQKAFAVLDDLPSPWAPTLQPGGNQYSLQRRTGIGHWSLHQSQAISEWRVYEVKVAWGSLYPALHTRLAVRRLGLWLTTLYCFGVEEAGSQP